MPLIFASVASGKTLLERVEERGKWPDPARRWCTSDFKAGPIERELRRYLKAHPRFRGIVFNAMGLRRDESAARARRLPWARSERNSRAGRQWFDWLPIFDLTADQVFRVVRDAGLTPHPAYRMGMSRLSCVFCIMASRADLRIAAQLQPALYRRYVELEERIDHTLSPSGPPLPAVTGVPMQPTPPPPSRARPARPSERGLSHISLRWPRLFGQPGG